MEILDKLEVLSKEELIGILFHIYEVLWPPECYWETKEWDRGDAEYVADIFYENKIHPAWLENPGGPDDFS